MRCALFIGLPCVLGSCVSGPSDRSEIVTAIRALEAKSGGRLGVILLDSGGKSVLAYRADERFAFCSSFKVALAGAVLDAAEAGLVDLKAPVAYSKGDLPGYQPVMGPKLIDGHAETTLDEAIDAAVLVSDNMAANLMIDALGGPENVTKRWRSWGDQVSRLDRRETQLNENKTGDQRDSSSPRAMAMTFRLLFEGDHLHRSNADRLVILAHRSTTGRDRVRAGLPTAWSAGDKTGTCAGERSRNGQYNDIGWFRAGPDGPLHWFAVMLDRPIGTADEAKAIHAELGRHFAKSAGHKGLH